MLNLTTFWVIEVLKKLPISLVFSVTRFMFVIILSLVSICCFIEFFLMVFLKKINVFNFFNCRPFFPNSQWLISIICVYILWFSNFSLFDQWSLHIFLDNFINNLGKFTLKFLQLLNKSNTYYNAHYDYVNHINKNLYFF